MNIARRIPTMTREEFFPWAEAQDAPYEFDGFAPVAMTGGNVRHDRITFNVRAALNARLRPPCQSFGPNAGLRTVGDAVRYPDALISCAKIDDLAHEVAAAVVVFEVLSPTSGHVDRIVKLREYRSVGSIRRYIIVEYGSMAATVHWRAAADAPWTATALAAEDSLDIPEVGIELPVAALYGGTGLT